MKKLSLVLICLICLLACAGIVCAAESGEETPVPITPNPQPTGYIPGYRFHINVFCNVEGASVDYKHGMGSMGAIGDSTIEHHIIKNGSVSFGGITSMEFISLNVSAPGYVPQTITDVTIPEPGGTVNFTINLKPVSAFSPVPLIGVITGLCAVVSVLMLRRRKI